MTDSELRKILSEIIIACGYICDATKDYRHVESREVQESRDKAEKILMEQIEKLKE